MKDTIETNNLAIWSALEKTDPKYTKEFNRGGFKGTAINATYVARKLTDTFGPIGKGWGYRIVDEKYVTGGPTFVKEGPRAGEKICDEVIHVLRIALWYAGTDGLKHEVEHFGQTVFVGANRYGVFTDEEAPKKSLTDAITKAASLLGCSADVHMGLFDDNKYVNTRIQEEDAKAQEEVWLGPLTKTALKTAVRELHGHIQGAATLDDLETIVKDHESITKQLEADLPAWWRGDEKSPGLRAVIETRRNELTTAEADGISHERRPLPIVRQVDGKSDWLTYANEMNAEIAACTTLDMLNELVELAGPALKNFAKADRKLFDDLKAKKDRKLAELNQSPVKEAAE